MAGHIAIFNASTEEVGGSVSGGQPGGWKEKPCLKNTEGGRRQTDRQTDPSLTIRTENFIYTT